jgi:antitoxin (DNA-binding transcriptional repressor) of toxin-antitoxin stability system
MSIQIDFQQLQSNLPQYLKQVEAGDTLVVCKDQKPVAELRPVKRPRPVGLGKGKITIAPNCFDPLPDDLLDAFEGKAE